MESVALLVVRGATTATVIASIGAVPDLEPADRIGPPP